MRVYLVGGAVRDRLLGLPVTERDWVVVGATPEQLTALGYKPVGRDFPVFLHPESKEEYALARTERKTAPGYRGFEVSASPSVSLKEDLLRRDLTINALAEDESGNLIDYYGGVKDLEGRVLRHVSPAFAEDPLRVLRVARFAARLSPLGFRVAEETMGLMAGMVLNGEVDALVPERVWQELVKALREPAPGVFFDVLRACGAQRVLFPELDRLWGVPQPVRHHPEIDTGVHTMMVLERAVELSNDPTVRFAALTHDLGKGTTPPSDWPSHRGHEERGVDLIEGLCDRLKAPKAYRELARSVARYHLRCHRIGELRPATVLRMLEGLDAFRRPDRLGQVILGCEADFRGRLGFETRPYPQGGLLRKAYVAATGVDARPLVAAGFAGEALADELRRRRCQAIADALASGDNPPPAGHE